MLETERTDRKDRASSLLNKEVGKESIVQAAGNGTSNPGDYNIKAGRRLAVSLHFPLGRF